MTFPEDGGAFEELEDEDELEDDEDDDDEDDDVCSHGVPFSEDCAECELEEEL